MSDTPLISCVMVTANRPELCRRAVASFSAQTYPNRELVVLDNGSEPARDSFASLNGELTYRYQPPDDNITLGELRNQSLEMARGEVIVPQWDDDDWCHPDRLAVQFDALRSSDSNACMLGTTMMHVDDPEYFNQPYVGELADGVPPTIMHWRDDSIRYLPMARQEDTHYKQRWDARVLAPEFAYLYLRYFHGANTWEREHFIRRARNSPRAWVAWVWWKHVVGNVQRHHRFRLDRRTRNAFESYLNVSRELGLFNHDVDPRPGN